MAESIEQVIETSLQALVSLPLSIARQAADMRIFHFGAIRPHTSGRGTVGSCALHIQCSWRIIDRRGIVTGYSDAAFGRNPETEPDADDMRSGDLQRIQIEDFMGGYDEATRSAIDPTGRRIATVVRADSVGSVEIVFNDDSRLQIFPDGSFAEDWRFISMDPPKPHLVIAGGRIESSEAV